MKPINWRVLAKVVLAYLMTASAFALFGLLLRFMQAFVSLLRFVLEQPESFFTNKMLFMMLVITFGGLWFVYWLAGLVYLLAKTAFEMWTRLLRPWRCAHGNASCEVGKKGVEAPRVFCSSHFMERVLTKAEMKKMKARLYGVR